MDRFKIFVFDLSDVQGAQDFLNKYPSYTIVDIHYYMDKGNEKVRFTLELE